MKNRKTVVVAFMLVAAMLLGVGYAAFTDTLTIDGTIKVGHENAEEAFDQDVYFDKVSTGTGYTASVNDDEAEFEITGLNTVGGAIEITYTVKNDNAFTVYATFENAFATKTEYFTVSLDEDQYEIPANSSVNVIVTVTMNKTPIVADGAEDYKENGKITFTVTEVTPNP